MNQVINRINKSLPQPRSKWVYLHDLFGNVTDDYRSDRQIGWLTPLFRHTWPNSAGCSRTWNRLLLLLEAAAEAVQSEEPTQRANSCSGMAFDTDHDLLHIVVDYQGFVGNHYRPFHLDSGESID